MSIPKMTLCKKQEVLRMSKNIEADIQCPFYLEAGDKFIKCEGNVKGTVCVHSFLDNIKKQNHEKGVCSVNCGKKCSHYRSVSLMYELQGVE